MKSLSLALATTATIIATSIGAHSYADPRMAGLIVNVAGETEPHVKRMWEVPPGTSLKLDAGGSVTLLQYASCRYVTIVGPGSATIMTKDIELDGAKVAKEQKGPCPVHYRMVGTMAGATLRGAVAQIEMPFDIYIAGPLSARVTSAELVENTDARVRLGTLTVENGHLTAPPGFPHLQNNQRCILELQLKEQAKPVDVELVIQDAGQMERMLILNLY